MMLRAGIRCVCGLAGAATLAATVVGCSDEIAGGLPVTAIGANLYARLETNHHAVLLSIVAPYNTVQLSTVPMDMNGNEWLPDHLTRAERDSLLEANPPEYLSQDEARVRVSANGLIQAVGTTTVTGTVRIIATRQLGNVTRADTTLVRVLNEPSPPRIKTFRLRPSDSLKVAGGSTLPMVLTALDSANNPILRVVTYARSSDADAVTIGSNSGGASGWNVTSVAGGSYRLGSARIQSQAYVYGIAVADTITMMNGHYIVRSSWIYSTTASNGTVSMQLSAPDVSVGPGGIVNWTNDTKLEPVSIEFDAPSTVLAAILPAQNTGGGNIIDIPFDSTLSITARSRYRRFLEPGIYTYRTNPYGLTGRVIVKGR
jgi:hypothetical protein